MVIAHGRAKKKIFPTRNGENKDRAINFFKMTINQKDTYIIDQTGDDEKKILFFRFI